MRPNIDQYMMGIAVAVMARANCTGTTVGAVIVKDGRIVSTGYNGTPYGAPNCDEGGCARCADPDQFEPGTGYDLCICVHAEQNALLAAARFGIACEGGSIYTTTRPCFGCTKELLQAKINRVYYLDQWTYPNETMQAQYDRLQARFPEGVKQVHGPDRLPEEPS